MTRTLTVALAVAALLVGCGGAPTDRAAVATAACDEPEFPSVQFGSHLLGDTPPPLPYSSTPPTSGWHASGAIPITIATLSDPQQVSVLEVGAIVITHDGLSQPERSRLEDHVRDSYADRVAVTPYPALDDGSVVLAGWGVLQRCDGVDLAALDTFVDVYAAEDPQVPGTDVPPREEGAGSR